MTFKPGKLYQINKYFWLLYPTKETADAAAESSCAVAARSTAASCASYWSKRLNCDVSFLNTEDTIMVVEVSGVQIKVINQEGKSGWINFPLDEVWVRKAISKVPDDT